MSNEKLSTSPLRSLVIGIVLTLMPFLSVSAFGEPLFYSGEEIAGRIVDADTNQPIAGAVVVVQWILFQMGVGDGHHDKRLHMAEAVSDANGRYVIPAWGPKWRPPFSELDYREPLMAVFKCGYQLVSMNNWHPESGSVRKSNWNGKTIKLTKFTGTAAERLSQLDTVLTYSGAGREPHLPLILLEMLKEESSFQNWPPDAPGLFDHVRNLARKKGEK